MGFSIKEVSEKLGIPPHTIRYYEKEGLLPDIQRDGHGNRVFEQKDLDWIKLMTCFRVTGMPVAALKNIVDLAVQGDSTISERKAILENHKQELQKRQMELDEAFEAVNYKLSKYESIQKGNIDAKSEFDMTSDQFN
ncbi:DNA-binding transcriptional regulator, MerR family [Paenibacillus sp. yr247]|uniref:MerR family transcriptional regulator n=1 Tax=Paenibacillus sp. yr247 TaxID=1761880 RepID=UPI00088DB15C|nr:MerR family transcriptional regulator [Paenibacillus sp. yr247]SDP03731.1 DNA-binding transcriptional regulator, MerR family [Paenibacillus sp. yr247]